METEARTHGWPAPPECQSEVALGDLALRFDLQVLLEPGRKAQRQVKLMGANVYSVDGQEHDREEELSLGEKDCQQVDRQQVGIGPLLQSHPEGLAHVQAVEQVLVLDLQAQELRLGG